MSLEQKVYFIPVYLSGVCEINISANVPYEDLYIKQHGKPQFKKPEVYYYEIWIKSRKSTFVNCPL